MAGFKNAEEAFSIMRATLERINHEEAQQLDIIYSYRFTDLDWSCTITLKPDGIQLTSGHLPGAETTIETTSKVFDEVMRGEMNVVYAHLTNQARTIGSLGNVLKLRNAVTQLSKAYRTALAERFTEQYDLDAETPDPSSSEEA